MMTIEEHLVTDPIRPWPCKTCRHHRVLPEGGAMSLDYFGCAWAISNPRIPPPSVFYPALRMGFVTKKQALGPHEGEPVECRAWEESE